VLNIRSDTNPLFKVAPFDEHYGLELEECTAHSVRGRVPVSENVTQPLGLVHGGVYAALAEALASLGTNRGVVDSGMVALGLSNHTTFLRPISAGHLRGHARCMHSGRGTWAWRVDMTDDDGRLCAASTVVVAVRRRPDTGAKAGEAPT
jgi:1,4-dihydroxy-2-naphthoyl-CoA hydrolase